MNHRKAAQLLLTERALDDLASIAEYSRAQWSRKTARRYIDDLQAGMSRLRDRPDLLQAIPDLPFTLKYYRVNKHLLVCDVRETDIVVLTVVHSSMDLPNRLAELLPTLAAEVELLHETLQGGKRRRK